MMITMFELVQFIFYSKIFWTFMGILLSVYLVFKTVIYSYWQRHGIPHDDFTVPIGVFGLGFMACTVPFADEIKKSYEKFKQYPFHGTYMFHRRVIIVNHPELIQSILIKDFTHFCDRGLYCNAKTDPLTVQLFPMKGEKWRALRSKLLPTFTAGKLKSLFPVMKAIADEMVKKIDEDLSKTDVLEIKDMYSRYGMDTIFSVCFGVDTKCIRHSINDELRVGGESVFSEGIAIMRTGLSFFAPSLMDFLRIRLLNRKTTELFKKVFDEMVDNRRKEDIKRQDYLDTLIDLMDHERIIEAGNGAKKLEPLMAAAQAFVFFFAGLGTFSATSTYWLYELALNPDIQEKVFQEINNVLKKSDGFTYQNVMHMEYLDMTFLEAMRKHPFVPFLSRICTEDYKMPGTDFIVPKGMKVLVSVSGIHRNPDFYPEPDKFDPTRFTKEKNEARAPCTYIPFGEGPRTCIGKRFAMVHHKLAMSYLLANFKFSVCDKTPIPSYYYPKANVQMPDKKIYLKVEKRVV